MPRLNQDDIPIGEDRWIPFVNVADRREHAIDLDPLLAPLADFWAALSVHCLPCCCALNAFTFEPEDIRHVSTSMDAGTLRRGLSDIRAFVQASESDVFFSHELGDCLHHSVILQLIDHISEYATASPAAQ